MPSASLPVFLARCPDYDQAGLDRLAGEALQTVGFHPPNGSSVLVKPNLLWADLAQLGYTHPGVVRAACLYLLDHGCEVSVADSPCFGRASKVARDTGLTAILEDLPDHVSIREMDDPVLKPLSLGGGTVAIARRALEADCILNIPKLKAHRMMRVTGAVKNLYGCICGLRKALLHSLHGDRERDGVPAFLSLVVDVHSYLPPTAALLDAVTGMHKTGPMKGEAFLSGFLAAGASSPALDTMLYTLLGLKPEDLPIGKELQRRAVPGSFPADLEWRGDREAGDSLKHFELPGELAPQAFTPGSLLVSGVKRVFFSLRG